MASAPNTKNDNQVTPFFTTLRRLARQVDNGVVDIQQKLELERKPGHKHDSHHVASVLLLDSRKDVEALKKNARSSLSEMRERNADFERVLQLSGELVASHLATFSFIQGYLCQYGYVPWQEKESDPEAETRAAQKDEATDSETCADEKGSSELRMLPRLEDFEISSYTINLMNRPPVHNVPNDMSNHYNNGSKQRNDAVPTPFQNKGLTVTPSLFSSQYRSQTSHSDLSVGMACSPINTVLGAQVGAKAEPTAPVPSSPEQPGLAKALDFADSPIPPVLHTPGVKQIPAMKDFLVQLQKENNTGQCSSPVPPVFMTPGLKQIPTKAELAKEESRSHRVAKQLNLGDDPGMMKPVAEGEPCLPRTPEMTYSLKDLEEMTMSFRNNSLTATSSELITPASSDLDSQEFQHGVEAGSRWSQQQDRPASDANKGLASSTHYSSFRGSRMNDLPSEPPLPNLRTNRFGFPVTDTKCRDMPETPELSSVNLTKSHASDFSMRKFKYGCSGKNEHATGKVSVFESSRTSADFPREGKSGASDFVSSQADACKFDNSAGQLSRDNATYNEPECSTDRARFGSVFKSSAVRDGQDHGNKENLETPVTPELTFHSQKLSEEAVTASEPGQPRLTQPLADSNLDLPPTPKFMGSYQFLGSKY